MIGLAVAVEALLMQRDGFAKAVSEWTQRYDELAQAEARRGQERMQLRDLLGARDHEISQLTKANAELHAEVRKLKKTVVSTKKRS